MVKLPADRNYSICSGRGGARHGEISVNSQCSTGHCFGIASAENKCAVACCRWFGTTTVWFPPLYSTVVFAIRLRCTPYSIIGHRPANPHHVIASHRQPCTGINRHIVEIRYTGYCGCCVSENHRACAGIKCTPVVTPRAAGTRDGNDGDCR